MAEADSDDSDQLELLNPFGNTVSSGDRQALFESLDVNDDQRITLKELKAVFKMYQFDADVTEIFKTMDTNGNKQINYTKFSAYLDDLPDEHFEVWSDLMSMSHLEGEPDDEDFSVDYVSACRRITQDWSGRVEAMQSFCRVILENASTEKEFRKLFQPMKEPLLTQLTDRRSIPVRMCCIVLGKLVLHRRNWLYRYVRRILSVLFQVIGLNVEIMSDSGHQCAAAYVNSMEDRKCEILNELIVATKSKKEKVRIRASEYLLIQIGKTDPTNKKYATWWKLMLKTLAECSKNASAEVRANALEGLAMCHPFKKDIVDRIAARFSGALKKKWQAVLQKKYTEKRPKRRKKTNRVATSVNIKAKLIAEGLIDPDPEDEEPKEKKRKAASPTSSKRQMGTPKARTGRGRKMSSFRIGTNTNQTREITDLKMEIARLQDENRSLQQNHYHFQATTANLAKINRQNIDLRQENDVLIGEIQELQSTLDACTDLMDQFDELQTECDELHRSNTTLNASLTNAIEIIQGKDEELEAQREENLELVEMCTELMTTLEEVEKSPQSPTLQVKNVQLQTRFRRISEAAHKKPHTPTTKQTKQQLWKTLTSSQFALPKSSSGNIINVSQAVDLPPDDQIPDLPEPTHKRRNTAQHRKRITQSKDFFKALIKEHTAKSGDLSAQNPWDIPPERE